MKHIFTVKSIYVLLMPVLLLLACKSSSGTVLTPDFQLLTVDASYVNDSSAELLISPYRDQLTKAMDVTIGHSSKRLTEKEGESLLGNFVADAILEQSSLYYPDKIHLSVINNGGLRAPIPEGPVKISNIYELMPFENTLYILELNAGQTKALFDLLASSKRIAVANSVVIVQDDKPAKIFIDGGPFTENQNYVLAVSDYLANGGGGMEFLEQAKVLEKTDVKIRDLIVDQIKLLESKGTAVDAEIEGRVKLVQ
jgi:2',3'-cyclic-nucleotide 2'-phosphodiesterase (5'-nucleotidase family)